MSGHIVSLCDRILERLHSELAVLELDTASHPTATAGGRHARLQHEIRLLGDSISKLKFAFILLLENVLSSRFYYDWYLELGLHDVERRVDEFFSDRIQRRKLVNFKLSNLFTGFHKLQHTSVLPTYFRSRFEEKANKMTQEMSTLEENCVLSPTERCEILKIVFCEGNDCNASVIPIISKLGVQKNVLARFVFNEEKQVQQAFDSKIWVRVSEVLFNTRKVDVSIFNCRTNQKIVEKLVEVDKLEDLVKHDITGKKFLLVVQDLRDTVEDDKFWCSLKGLLSGGERGTTVLITTSHEEVAEKTGTRPPFLLDSYSEFNEDEFISELCNTTKIPDSIVSKWLESTLSKNNDKAWKVTVTKTIEDIVGFNYISYIRLRRRTEGTHNDDQLDKIEIDRSLFQRYVKLPWHLKQCFEYCRLFPKDYEIDVQTLINLWMAQGFIKLLDPSQCLEDVGRKYFVDLLERRFFQNVDQSDHILGSDVIRCKIDCSGYNLLVILGGMRHVLLHPRDEDFYVGCNVTNHVSFDFHLHSPRQIPRYLQDIPELIRSILLPRQSQSNYEQGMIDVEKILHIVPQSTWPPVYWRPGFVGDAIISRFRDLRALDLHELGIKVVPHYIGNLTHLRYLDLSSNAQIKALPASITKLVYLQTLKLSRCIELEELPKDIKNLVNLRSLGIDGCYNLTRMPLGFGQLTSLLVLSQFVVNKDVENSRPSSQNKDSISAYKDSGGLNELEKLNKLRGELQIKNLTPTKDAKAAVLGEKQDLRVLSLEWDIDETRCGPGDYEKQLEDLKPHSNLKGLALHGYGGGKFSSWLNPQMNLVKLTMRKCSACKNLPPLSQFVKLKVLVVDEMAELEYVENEPFSPGTKFFPALQELRLTKLPKLQGWWETSSVSKGSQEFPSFPCLSKLEIEDCPKLDTMPLFPTLEGLVLDSTCLNPLHLTMEQKSANSGNQDEASSSTTSPPSPLSNLKNLCIVDIDTFDDSRADEIDWDTLKSLQLLKFSSLPSLTTLPKGLQRVTSLQEFHVEQCGIKEIPTWIGEVKSLEKLVIRLCPELKTLPGEDKFLSSFKKMEIDDCPKLMPIVIRLKMLQQGHL